MMSQIIYILRRVSLFVKQESVLTKPNHVSYLPHILRKSYEEKQEEEGKKIFIFFLCFSLRVILLDWANFLFVIFYSSTTHHMIGNTKSNKMSSLKITQENIQFCFFYLKGNRLYHHKVANLNLQDNQTTP